jgi:hypothetical protein
LNVFSVEYMLRPKTQRIECVLCGVHAEAKDTVDC